MGRSVMRVGAVVAMMGIAALQLTARERDVGTARAQARGPEREQTQPRGQVRVREQVPTADAGHSHGGRDGESATSSPLGVLRSGASDAGFARALAVRRFEFPRDHGPHPAYRHEWWYFTGHLQAADGERFGFEVTFFRVALAPAGSAAPEAPHETRASKRASAGTSAGMSAGALAEASDGTPVVQHTSHWRARQIYVAHFAITDIGRRTFHSTQRFARDALGLAGAQAAPFRVWLDGWSVAGRSAPGGQQDEAGEWTLHVADPAYDLTLQLRPRSAPVLNGDRGLSVKSDEQGAASYYYSIPRLAARGRLVRGGSTERGAQTLDVSGTAWLDREWGSGSLGPHQQGWDWFALQLGDGSALMFYALRDDGGARDPHSAGTWVAPDGSSRPLASSDVRIDALDHWTSPHSARYPSRWRIRIRSLGLDVTATPVLDDQELDTAPRYWEGDVDVSGSRGGRALSGQGYVELVGYPSG